MPSKTTDKFQVGESATYQGNPSIDHYPGCPFRGFSHCRITINNKTSSSYHVSCAACGSNSAALNVDGVNGNTFVAWEEELTHVSNHERINDALKSDKIDH